MACVKRSLTSLPSHSSSTLSIKVWYNILTEPFLIVAHKYEGLRCIERWAWRALYIKHGVIRWKWMYEWWKKSGWREGEQEWRVLYGLSSIEPRESFFLHSHFVLSLSLSPRSIPRFYRFYCCCYVRAWASEQVFALSSLLLFPCIAHEAAQIWRAAMGGLRATGLATSRRALHRGWGKTRPEKKK